MTNDEGVTRRLDAGKFVAALCATIHNPLLKAFYKKLRAKGKPTKVALTAVMRKLLPHLNSLLKIPLQYGQPSWPGEGMVCI